MVAIDVGGGTLDTTVAEFRNGEDPIILKSNFGASVGGANVDENFINDLKALT